MKRVFIVSSAGHRSEMRWGYFISWGRLATCKSHVNPQPNSLLIRFYRGQTRV